MYGKLIIECELVVRTGMHIGGSSVFSAIGAVDSPVICDSYTRQPIVPGSSLKGKLRTLLSRSLNPDIEHMPDHNHDGEELCRLFGSNRPVRPSRLQFADAFVCNEAEMREVGLTEIKTENTINRRDCSSSPRQIERVVPGVRFAVRMVYDVRESKEEAVQDMRLLAKGLKLLQMDYLGGHGTRGSGRVSFQSFVLKDFETGLNMEELLDIFKEAEEYELLPV